MTSGMNEAFGALPNRPDTKEFWRLSELVLKYDGRMDDATDKEVVFRSSVNEFIELETLSYVAMQRAMRAVGATTKAQVAANMPAIATCASMYIDGFVHGCAFKSGE